MEKQERFYFDVWIALLSTLAGMVNVVTLLLFFTPTTHFTGNITQFVLSFNEEEWGTILHLLGMILCFSGGGVLSGFLFSKKKFEPTKRYGVLLMMFGSMMLLLFLFGLRDEKWLYFFSFVVGTQKWDVYLLPWNYRTNISLYRLFNRYWSGSWAIDARSD